MHLSMQALVLVLALGDGEATPMRPLLQGQPAYEQQTGELRSVEGVLEVMPRDGRIGQPPRRLVYRLRWLDGGTLMARPVFLNGLEPSLAPFVGYRVQMEGKLIPAEPAQRREEEFWPGRFAAVGVAPPNALTEVPILARTNDLTFERANRQTQPYFLAMRSAEGAAKAIMVVVPPNGPEQATEHLARRLGVPTIDWKKQMVLHIHGGFQRGVGPLRVEIDRVLVDEKGMSIHWRFRPGQGGGGRQMSIPSESILVPRNTGEIRFYREGDATPVLVPPEGETAEEK
jgi:hypothetical protein